MGKIVIRGFFRNRRYWSLLAVLSLAFNTALAILSYGDGLFEREWRNFQKGQEIPRLVLYSREEEAPIIEKRLSQHPDIRSVRQPEEIAFENRRSWYLVGNQEKLERLEEDAKRWEGVSCQRYTDTSHFANACEMSRMLGHITVFFSVLFALAEAACLLAVTLAVKKIRERTDESYRIQGVEGSVLLAGYVVYLGSALAVGMTAGCWLGGRIGIKLAQEGLTRLGISCSLAGNIKFPWYLAGIPAMIMLTVFGRERPGFLRISSLCALFLAVVVTTAALQYERARVKLTDDIFEKRYHYKQLLLFDDFLEREIAEKKMEEAGETDYEWMAGLFVTLKKDGYKVHSQVMAICSDSRAVQLYDQKGQRIFPRSNQIVISSQTAKRLQADKGDILSYEAFPGGHCVKGSCLIGDVSEQYSQFTEYVLLEDAAGYLQSGGVVGGCFLMGESGRRTDGVRYLGGTREQKMKMEESFHTVAQISRSCCLASVFIGGLMGFLFCRSLLDTHRESCRCRYFLGQNRWEIFWFLVRQGLYQLLLAIAGGFAAGTAAAALFLKEISSDRFSYPPVWGEEVWFSLYSPCLYTIICVVGMMYFVRGRKRMEKTDRK